MDLGAALGLPTLTILQLAIAGFTVFLIQKTRMLLCKHVKARWTQRIPSWVWFALSIIIPVGMVWMLQLNWVQALVNTAAPPEIAAQVNTGDSGVVWSGIATAMGAGGSYAGLKKAGLTGDYSPGGPNDITPPPDVVAAPAPEMTPEIAPIEIPPNPYVPVPEAEVWQEAHDRPSARLFVRATPAVNSGYYVLVKDQTGERLVPIDTEGDAGE